MDNSSLNQWTVGIELEATLLCSTRGSPVVAAGLIRAAGPDAEVIGLEGEVGLHQVEFHSPVFGLQDAATGIASWADSIRRWADGHGVTPYFCSRSPFWRPQGVPTVDVQSLPRCAAILAAIDEYAGPGHGLRIFGQTAAHNALQFHLRPPGFQAEEFFTDFGVRIVNAFAASRRRMQQDALSLGDGSSVGAGDDDREKFWSLAPGRGPTDGPYTLQSLIERWTCVPRLVRRRDDGGWQVNLERPSLQEVYETGLHGTIWERVRPSPSRPDKPATLEIRVHPAVPPERIDQILTHDIIPTLESIRGE